MQFDEYRRDLRAVIHGNNIVEGVYITLRMRLRCEVFRNGKAMPGKVFDVLNEIVVDRGSNPYLSKIECYEHDRLITKVRKHVVYQLHLNSIIFYLFVGTSILCYHVFHLSLVCAFF